MENNKQMGAPCPIGIERNVKTKTLNYIENGPDAKCKRVKKPARKMNIIKIRMADNPKDIVIKFADKETLIKTLREFFDL